MNKPYIYCECGKRLFIKSGGYSPSSCPSYIDPKGEMDSYEYIVEECLRCKKRNQKEGQN